MTEPTLRAARRAALDTIAALRADLDAMMAASESSNGDDEHDPEGATIAFERAQSAALLGRANTRLAEVDAAMARLAAGGYGRCEVCGGPIGAARLEARPATARCIGCA